MARFPFNDLHSFKDYVVYVQTYLPDRFRHREGVGPNDQWSLELAFKGLREGIALSMREKGCIPALSECQRLIEEAYREYLAGREREGFFKLEEVNEILRMVPSQ